MSLALKRKYKKEISEEARENGWIDPDTLRLLPEFHSWWKSVEHLPYSQIQKEWEASPYIKENPHSPHNMDREVEEKGDELMSVLSQYQGMTVDGPRERRELVSTITSDLLEVTDNTQLVKLLLKTIDS